jgi:hypothetical protein
MVIYNFRRRLQLGHVNFVTANYHCAEYRKTPFSLGLSFVVVYAPAFERQRLAVIRDRLIPLSFQFVGARAASVSHGKRPIEA